MAAPKYTPVLDAKGSPTQGTTGSNAGAAHGEASFVFAARGHALRTHHRVLFILPDERPAVKRFSELFFKKRKFRLENVNVRKMAFWISSYYMYVK